jgi:hypothetical protein
MTVSRSLIVLGVCALVAPAPVAAQSLGAARVGIDAGAAANGGLPTAALHVTGAVAGSHRQWRYILGGAAVGAIAGGLLLANRIAHEQDPRLVPRHTVVYIGLGAGLGAVGGWALSRADWWPPGKR